MTDKSANDTIAQRRVNIAHKQIVQAESYSFAAKGKPLKYINSKVYPWRYLTLPLQSLDAPIPRCYRVD